MPENEQEPQGPLTASVERLRKELDHWLEAALNQGERALDKIGLRGAGRCWWPAVDVIENPDTIEVLADVPGVDTASIDLTLVGNMLTIEGQKPAFEAGDDQTVHTRERTGGKFSRSVPMPAAVNPDNVTAEVSDGTLRVRLSKAERAIRHQIKVNVPKASAGAGAASTKKSD